MVTDGALPGVIALCSTQQRFFTDMMKPCMSIKRRRTPFGVFINYPAFRPALGKQAQDELDFEPCTLDHGLLYGYLRISYIGLSSIDFYRCFFLLGMA